VVSSHEVQLLPSSHAESDLTTLGLVDEFPAGDTLRVLNAISMSNTSVHQTANHLEQEDASKESFAWDDTALQVVLCGQSGEQMLDGLLLVVVWIYTRRGK
jgi:hypothetical protein